MLSRPVRRGDAHFPFAKLGDECFMLSKDFEHTFRSRKRYGHDFPIKEVFSYFRYREMKGLRHRKCRLAYLVDAAFHIERLLRFVVVLPFDNLLETTHRLFARDILTRHAGERFADEERLGQEAFELASARD